VENQIAIAFERLGNLALRTDQLLILYFEFGLINPQLFEQMAVLAFFRTSRTIVLMRLAALDSPFGPFPQLPEVYLLMAHDPSR
jgi:hypothetical protein